MMLKLVVPTDFYWDYGETGCPNLNICMFLQHILALFFNVFEQYSIVQVKHGEKEYYGKSAFSLNIWIKKWNNGSCC